MKPAQRKLYKKTIAPPPVPVVVTATPKQPLYLHKFSDGSILKVMNAKEFSSLPVWYSQRTLDEHHRDRIRRKLHDNIENLDGSLYHIVEYESEESEEPVRSIIDGQHRAGILKEYFQNKSDAKDFPLVVKIKYCDTTEEAIQYFKILNTTKSIEWKEDPNLVAQKYIKALLKEFNNETTKFFRECKTKRPYVQLEKLQTTLTRGGLVTHLSLSPEDFAKKAKEWNEQKLEQLIDLPRIRTSIESSAIHIGFVLGLDEQFQWIDSIVV